MATASRHSAHRRSPRPHARHDALLERLNFLADGIFAIALTLLALDLRLPVDPAGLTERQLLSALLETWPRVLGYATSFLVLAIIWVGDHHFTRFLQRADTNLAWLTFLHLSFVAFLPFPTALVGERPDSVVAAEFYCASLLLTMATVLPLTWYATWGHRLVAPDLPPRFLRYHRLRPLAGMAVLLLLLVVIPFGLGRLVPPLLAVYVLGLGYIVVFTSDRDVGGRRQEAAQGAPRPDRRSPSVEE